MKVQNTDKQRHAGKVLQFDKACERAGIEKVLEKIGKGAYSSMLCARDAQLRNQSPATVAGFLSDANSRFCDFVDDKWQDIQLTLKSI